MLNPEKPLWSSIVLKTGSKLSRASRLAELDYPVAMMSTGKPAQAERGLVHQTKSAAGDPPDRMAGS